MDNIVNKTDVLIAGGGPVGMTLALELAQCAYYFLYKFSILNIGSSLGRKFMVFDFFRSSLPGRIILSGYSNMDLHNLLR